MITKTQERLIKLAAKASPEAEAKVKAAIEKSRSAKATKVVAVCAVDITGGYRYEAVMADGSRQVIRKKATRLYPKAFYYADRIRKVSKNPLPDFFTFGKAPSNKYVAVKSTFVIRAPQGYDPQH